MQKSDRKKWGVNGRLNEKKPSLLKLDLIYKQINIGFYFHAIYKSYKLDIVILTIFNQNSELK